MKIRSPDIPVRALGQGCPIYEGVSKMDNLTVGFRGVGALILGGLGTLIGFGILLGLAWLPSQNTTYKLVALLLVAAIAITLGGFISGSIGKQNKIVYGLVFGLLFGLVSFAYIFGVEWRMFVAVLVSTALGALGGWLAILK
jgi:hypothetical protein